MMGTIKLFNTSYACLKWKSVLSRFLARRTLTNMSIVVPATGSIRQILVRQAFQCQPDDRNKYFLKGWIRALRSHKGTTFIDLDDGSSVKRLQVVLKDDLVNNLEFVPSIGSSVAVVGSVIKSIYPKQPIELACDEIKLIGSCDNQEFPFSLRGLSHESEELRRVLHLRVRLKLFSSIIRLRSELINAIHIFMKQNDFINVTTPLITSVDSEGGGHVFTIKSEFCHEKPYFEKDVHLTVSSQLHLEAIACAMSRVYSLSQTFRAERSQMHNRHLNEFLMFEVEEAFVETVDHLMDRVESTCKFLAYYCQQNCSEDLGVIHDKTKYKHFNKIASEKYIRISYEEAAAILTQNGECPNFKTGQNFTNQQEQLLLKHFNYTPLFVIDFPAQIKPFYMKQADGKALCFDLLSPICGEVCGGSLREDNHEALQERIAKLKSPETFDWYLDLRKFGSVPHGGFGIGFDRLVQTITGMPNLKEVASFPRWYSHCFL